MIFLAGTSGVAASTTALATTGNGVSSRVQARMTPSPATTRAGKRVAIAAAGIVAPDVTHCWSARIGPLAVS